MTFIIALLMWQDRWTPVLNAEIESSLPKLEMAKDISEYCPNYANLNHDKRVGMWATMVESITGFESGYNPDCKTYESSLGIYSLGLLQLSKEDQWSFCDEDQLLNPYENLHCGVKYMSLLITEDKYIAKGGQKEFDNGTAQGLSRYWSTMWPPSSAGGHKVQIKKAVKDYCIAAKAGEL